MKNDIDKNMLDKFKINIAISNFEEEQDYVNKRNTPKNKIDWRIYVMKKKIIAAISMSVILTSGVVLANNIENIKKFFGGGLDAGVQTAAENGYIANPEMNYIESNTTVADVGTILENVPTEAKIEDFMMDDVNLNIEFEFNFDEKIKDNFNLDNLHNIDLDDLIIRDEENRILYAGNDKEAFEKYCDENNLDYVFGETNENYMNCGLQYFPYSHEKGSNSVKLTYNIYTDTFPKSKKLYLSFGKIKLIEEITQNTVTLKGNWNIELDVPEKMYNRTSENYKVVSCDNEDFEVYASKVSDTGFEIGVIISNIERMPSPFSRNELDEGIDRANKESEGENLSNLSQESIEFLNKYNEWIYRECPIQINSFKRVGAKMEKDNPSYVENDNGKQFKCTFSPSRKAETEWLNGNKYKFYETFGMTKYDSTDKIKAVLYYYGEPVTIELEKVK